MVLQLMTHTAREVDLSSISSTHLRWLRNTYNSSSRRADASEFCQDLHSPGHAQRHKHTHIHVAKNT